MFRYSKFSSFNVIRNPCFKNSLETSSWSRSNPYQGTLLDTSLKLFSYVNNRLLQKMGIKMFKKSQNTAFSQKKMYYQSKKGFFNGGFNFIVGPTIRLVLSGYIGIYLLGWTMSQGQYIKQFLFEKSSFYSGNFLSLVTSHFTKIGTLDFILESLITVLLANNIVMMHGEAILKRLITHAVGYSSLIMLLFHNSDGIYLKSDAITRSLIYFIVFKNPQHSFILFPLPFPIKAMYLGIFLVIMDIMSAKHCNFGGAISAFALARV